MSMALGVTKFIIVTGMVLGHTLLCSDLAVQQTDLLTVNGSAYDGLKVENIETVRTSRHNNLYGLKVGADAVTHAS
jgi:hypothetical protein